MIKIEADLTYLYILKKLLVTSRRQQVKIEMLVTLTLIFVKSVQLKITALR